MAGVSRASPVQTVMRNCTRDEGRPFGVGNQVPISSHRKLPLSKAMVVSVAELPRTMILAGTVERDERKQTAERGRWQNRGVTLPSGISLGDVLRLPKRHPACRRREAQLGSCTDICCTRGRPQKRTAPAGKSTRYPKALADELVRS